MPPPATLHQLRKLIRALACPIDGDALDLPPEFEAPLYECWYNVLARRLPDRMIAGALIDDFQSPSREPSEDSLGTLYLYVDEADGFLVDILGSRLDMVQEHKDLPSPARRDGYDPDTGANPPKSRCGVWVDQEFKALCGWVQNFKALGPEDYDKHYASSPDRSAPDLLAESRQKRDIGLLLPSLTPDVQRHAYFEAVAYSLKSRLDESEEDFPKQRVEAFHSNWCDAFSQGRQRFALKYPIPVGAWGGRWASWLVFDADPQNGHCHSYPALTAPPDIPVIPSAPVWSVVAASRDYFAGQGMPTPTL